MEKTKVKLVKSFSYSTFKAKYTKKFIMKLMEARTLSEKQVKGEEEERRKKINAKGEEVRIKITPFITPQQLEFGLFLVTQFLSSKISTRKPFIVETLTVLSYKFASNTDYFQHRTLKTNEHPNEQTIQKSLAKLKSIGLIYYEYGPRPLSLEKKHEYKSTGKKIPQCLKIYFQHFNSQKTVKEMYHETSIENR
jgi:hypothetical protein